MRCGGSNSIRSSSTSASCATCAGCSTSRCGCSRPFPATTGPPVKTPCWPASTRCARASGRSSWSARCSATRAGAQSRRVRPRPLRPRTSQGPARQPLQTVRRRRKIMYRTAIRAAPGGAHPRCADPPLRPDRRPRLLAADSGAAHDDAARLPARPAIAVARQIETRPRATRTGGLPEGGRG